MTLLCSEEEEWFKSRSPISKFTMIPRKVGEFHEDFNAITHDLVRAVRKMRDKETNVLHDVPPLLFNWSFECKVLISNTSSFVSTHAYVYMCLCLQGHVGCLDYPKA